MIQMPRCKATSKRSGERCKKDAMVGKKVCHIHGGKTPIGMEHPNFRTGRRSRYLPDRLREKYEAALMDEDALSLIDEIAVIDARISEEMATLGGSDDLTRWVAAQRVYDAILTHTQAERHAEAAMSIRELGEVLRLGRLESVAWRNVYELIERRRKLVETERKRLFDEDKAIPVEQFMMLISVIGDAIRRHVRSEAERRGVILELDGLLERDTGAA